ncbi:hypothetical protein BDQ17DRAFT_1262934, partial [Cyathus striatus]
SHPAHSVIVLWSLGAHESIIEASYEASCAMQSQLIKSERYAPLSHSMNLLSSQYNSYLNFFTAEIKSKGAAVTLEEYIFSANANIGSTSGKGEPTMVSRFVDGLIHPFIHTRYGFEFGLPGMVAEGTQQITDFNIE